MSKQHIASGLVYLAGFGTLVCMYGFSNSPHLILVSLALLGLVMLFATRNIRYVLWYVAALLLGPLILDIPGMYVGLWSYGTLEFLNFPLWLPFFYGNVTVSFIYFVLATQAGIGRR